MSDVRVPARGGRRRAGHQARAIDFERLAASAADRTRPVDGRLALVERALTEHWESARFPRLAETAADDGPCGSTLDNPYWRFVRLMPRGGVDPADEWAVEFSAPVRDLLVTTYAWSIPSPADLTWIRDVLGGRDVLEIGAGSGYWAWLLRQLGIDVVAVDDKTSPWERQWTEVPYGNTTDAFDHPDRALMLIRPPHAATMAQTALDCYDGDLLIFAGDETTAAGRIFYDTLATRWEEIAVAPYHPTFVGIPCRLRALRRR